MKKNLLVLLLLVFSQIVMAVPAKRELRKITQTNGVTLHVYLNGDERLSWYTTADNYALLYNNDRILEYAFTDASGNLSPSGVEARDIEDRSLSDIQFLSTIEKGLFFSENQENNALEKNSLMSKSMSTKAIGDPIKGTKSFLVILVNYKDDEFTYSRKDVDNLFNQINYREGGATGSVKDYFRATSAGQFDIETIVVGPYTLPNNKAYYGDNIYYNGQRVADKNATQMIKDAVTLADPDVDFREFVRKGTDTVEGIYVIYAGQGEANGGGEETIWPHRSMIHDFKKDGVSIVDYACSSEKNREGMSGIGVICHELGHMLLGLLDYYDTDYGKRGVTPTLSTLEIMDDGAYNNNERTPPLYNAFSKYQVGWVDPIVLSPGDELDIIAYPVSDSNQVFRINTEIEKEYFLIENKQRNNPWDEYMYGEDNYPGGLVVLHVNEGGYGWDNNCINCFSSFPSIKLLYAPDSVAKGMETGETEENKKFKYDALYSTVYPGFEGIGYLTDSTPSNLKSWGRQNTNVPLWGIRRLENGNVTFKTYKDDTKIDLRTLYPKVLTSSFAGLRGKITRFDNSINITERGFVIDNEENFPLNSFYKAPLGSGAGDYTYTFSLTDPFSPYYYKAYAIIDNDTIYGDIQVIWVSNSSISNNYILEESISICLGTDTYNIDASDPQGGNGAYSYQWEQSTDNNIFIPIEGQTDKDLNLENVSTNTSFWIRRVVYSADKISKSQSVNVSIYESLSAGILSSDKLLISPSESTGKITISGYQGNILYWERKKNDGNWDAIPSSTNMTEYEEVMQEEGSYSFRAYVDAGSCGNAYTNTVSIQVKNEDIVVYPNPSNGIFYVGTKLEGLDLLVISADGRIVREMENLTSATTINLSSFNSGVYIFMFKDGKKIVNKSKIIIANR